MELYLQLGHGMQALSKELIKNWNGGTVIISPVNMSQSKIPTYAKEINDLGGNVLFDPQLFYPKDGHNKLQAYDYWPAKDVSVTSNNGLINTNREILKINNSINSPEIILPNIQIDDNRLQYSFNWLIKSADYFSQKTDKPLLATICLHSDTIRNLKAIEELIEQLKQIPVNGFYIIPHSYGEEYIVSDLNWCIGILKLITCLKLASKQVIVGYSNHQSLLYSLANVDAIASGTYMNTRSFVPSKFKIKKDDDIKQKSTWFYLPTAFTEYKATLLDVAWQRNYLDLFKPQGEFHNPYSDVLFNGEQPSTTNYNEPNSFKHYLHCLNIQCKMLTLSSYEETFNTYEFMINNAENQINELKKHGMKGYNRDFSPAIETNRVAMCANDEDYGFKLRFDWNKDK